MSDCRALKLATEAVQAHERLSLFVKNHKTTYSSDAFDHSVKALDHLKLLKSELEGSHIKFEKVRVNKDILQEKIRPLMLMNVPDSLSVETKKNLSELIEDAFQGTCKKVIFAGLLTCPWYGSMQEDRGLRAKHNNIFVVYQYKDTQVFTPVNPHVNEQNQVLDEDWFYASELEHFVHYLYKGSVRFVECLYLPDTAIICQSKEWEYLKTANDTSLILGLRGFLEQCRGQAIGAVSKKSSSGQLKVKDAATLYEFCESSRLLHHAHSVLKKSSIRMDIISEKDLSLSEFAKDMYSILTRVYQQENSGIRKDQIFKTLMKWKSEIDVLMKTHVFTKPNIVEQLVGQWLFTARTERATLQALETVQSEKERLLSLMKTIGGNVAGMSPEQILMIARAGSFLYGLNTPESDTDYVVIYADQVENVFGNCKRPVESFEKRGPKLDFEYGAYEARLFAEMLWKGSVVILELVFADNLEYISEYWKDLVANKKVFLTERAILQYFGLIKNNMVMIENGRFKGKPRERKLFYQIFHKLDSLEYFVKGDIPPIRCEGTTKEFIMKIRRGSLEGEVSRDSLYSLAKEKVASLRDRLSKRENRLPENVNYDFLQEWLMKIRGWNA